MYSAIDIARYIIWYCKSHGYTISNLKLQKILYFVQAEFLVSAGAPCFYEDIEAWDFGPVIPEVYHEFKIYGSSGIPGSRSIIQIIRLLNLVEIVRVQDLWNDAYERYCNNVISNDNTSKRGDLWLL